MKNVAAATRKMIGFYHGNRHDIAHFLKVWALAKTIGELEGLDGHTQEALELAAVVHDIACPLCREKYGDTNGKHQELESPPLVEAFFADLPVSRADVDRISWLAAHHHTDTNVDGPDHRILLEADFLVNADEGACARPAIEAARTEWVTMTIVWPEALIVSNSRRSESAALESSAPVGSSARIS